MRVPRPERCFDDQREADLLGSLTAFSTLVTGLVGTRHNRHAGLFRQSPRGGLVAEQIEQLRRRPRT